MCWELGSLWFPNFVGRTTRTNSFTSLWLTQTSIYQGKRSWRGFLFSPSCQLPIAYYSRCQHFSASWPVFQPATIFHAEQSWEEPSCNRHLHSAGDTPLKCDLIWAPTECTYIGFILLLTSLAPFGQKSCLRLRLSLTVCCCFRYPL